MLIAAVPLAPSVPGILYGVCRQIPASGSDASDRAHCSASIGCSGTHSGTAMRSLSTTLLTPACAMPVPGIAPQHCISTPGTAWYDVSTGHGVAGA
eukprot:2255565-Rhodomonas_salina.1